MEAAGGADLLGHQVGLGVVQRDAVGRDAFAGDEGAVSARLGDDEAHVSFARGQHALQVGGVHLRTHQFEEPGGAGAQRRFGGGEHRS